jgi:hypothetical protein
VRIRENRRTNEGQTVMGDFFQFLKAEAQAELVLKRGKRESRLAKRVSSRKSIKPKLEATQKAAYLMAYSDS